MYHLTCNSARDDPLMQHTTDDQSPESPETVPTFRRPLLQAIAGAGAVGLLGVPQLAQPARASVPGVKIDYKRCKVAFVTNASAIDAIAVYYADRDGDRNARYDVAPTTTDPRGYAPLVVEYDADEDRTQIQLADPQGSLVCVIAEAGSDRTVLTNPTEACVPAGFNTAPTASFDVSESPTVGEPVTFTSTATDPDSPEQLYYAWDLDGDGTFESSGETATTTFLSPGDVTISHRVTDDCGASETATQTITVVPGETGGLYEQVAKLTADTPGGSDLFGYSVSVDGDTALVGVRAENRDGITNAGSAYVFVRTNGVWSQQQKLTADDAEDFDEFGFAVSVDGDTALIGAWTENRDGLSNVGSAYVFTRSNGVWSQQQKLTADDAAGGDLFGTAVSVDGNTALVGARAEDPNGIDRAGSAYVFVRTNGVWSQQQKLTADDAGDLDQFGFSVSVDGDTALVGAFFQNRDGLSNVGSAYVFTRSNGVWSQQQKLTADDAGAGDYFGFAVSLDGDTALVGAWLEDPNGLGNAGSAYVFVRSGVVWSQQQKLTADDAAGGDYFGRSVSVDGDTALIGAWGETRDGLSNVGSAYVFVRSNAIWSQQQKLTAADAEDFDNFGWSVSVDGDTALVGAWLEDPNGIRNAGSAYVFST